MDEVKEITEIIEAYSDASCTERSGEGKEDYEETIRRSIAKAFGEPRVGDCAALAYLSVARTAWKASEENAGCAQTMAEGLSDGLFHTRCSANVRGLAADTLAEVVSVSARAKEAVFTRCIAALSTASADQPQQQQQQQQEEVSLVGTAEVLGQLFTGRAAVEAVVSALCAPGVSQQARRMLVRVALVPLVERGTEADNTDDCLELVWDSVLKTRDTQTILMTVAQLSKAFMHRGSKDFMHRKELWDTIYSALCNSTDDLYAKNCAVFVIGRYAECCGNACEKELWESFVIVWEALETHATELIKPAWKRLESLVRPGRERYLEPRWPTLLFDRALNHFHVPIRRVILVSFLSHGAYSAGVLATDPAFLESVAFRIFCDQVLYKGELRPFSAKLINGFLDSFLSLPIPAAAVVTAYLNALSSAPLFDTKYLSSLLDGRFKIEADEKMIEALILFANKCATSQHFVIRAHACRLVIRALPALLLLRQAETAVTLDVLVPLLDAFPRTELAAERATLQLLVASNADTLLASITTELDAIASRNYNNSSNGNDGLNEHDWRRCDSLLFVFTLLPQTPQAEEELVSCVSKLAAAAVAGKGRSAMNTLAVITGAADRSLRGSRALQDESTVDALVEHTLQELNCGAYCSVRCCAAWIRGFCTNALNSDRTYKLQPVLRKAAEVVKSSASVPAGDRHRSLAAAYSALLVIHALETTAKQQLKELQHLIDSKDIITLAPTMEVPLPKEEAELLLGATAPAPWSERLGEMSLCAWETLRELPFPRGDSAAWGRVLDAIAYPPSSAGLTALLEAVTAWVAADKGFVTPKELRKASRRGFRAVTGEFPSDRALLDAWTRLAFHPALVQDAEFVGFTKKLMQKVFAYGQKNALAVNRMAAQFILGFSWEDEEKKKKEGGGNHYTLLEHEYFDELCEMLVFGPNRDQFDGTYFMSLAYDDELLDESAYALPLSSEAETKAAAAGRAKDLRDYYTRVLANALVLAAPAESRLPGLVLERVNEALTEDLRAHITLYSDRSRRQLRHLQTLCLLAPRAGQAEGDKLAACLAQMLAHDAYAPVRAFSLLALTRLALADPRRAEPLRRAIENPGQKNFFLHAALTVWGTVLANAPLERAPALVDDLVPRIIPHISGPVAIKTTAQCALTVLLEQGRIAHKPALEAVVRSITQFLGGGGTAAATPSSSNSSNGDTDHMSQLLVAWLAMGSLLRCSISDVFHRLPLSVEGYPGPDIATNAFCEEVAQTAFSFTASCTDGVVFAEGGVPVPIVPSEHRAALVSRYCSRRTPLPYEIWGGEKAAGTGQVQRKPLPWIVGDEEEITRLTRRTRQNLILVASLVDKPPNLGGMCRTADIFNIREYVIPDAKLKNHPQFQAVAVTSDHWVPISVVNEEGLPAYLAQKRKEGYKLFGVEQTNESISLNDVVFPDRSLLLLGKEQQGIPANLIALLDACIEVPQLGFIRSLNVHVTAALVTWEYSKQHAFAEKKIAAKK